MHTLRALIPASLLVFGSSACVLTGIELDEIDVADEETGGDTGLTGANEGDPGDGDGDPAGDGDGDSQTGDGDGDDDPSGDGDGDDGDPSGDGDGDNESLDCFGHTPAELSEGQNQVEVSDGASELTSTCGGVGPETVYEFTAPSEGDWQFVIEESDFTEVLILADGCEPLQELTCSAAPVQVQQFLSAGQRVLVIVDSERGTGTATLDINKL